ncbi:putative bifunctional diguanylate cyclase/phosphodiesterase [Nocardioides iriomotensis]|uniref:Bifunctional diguanylate cyclase/phosphodiesterase n=1 Tax=Nocardioides iriomotensis TaxID=715784 RepID=A0A4Q5J692_9ACTN|nr:EAL domain-containing protein [Nocardioides iriomotensis]RYU14170.1 bifunctional diguanylate cyclase/phosphodiesterase [Nocardioides iriomotensis]
MAWSQRAARRRVHKGTTLLAIYAAASLVPVLALGVTLVRGYHDAGITRATSQALHQVAVIERMVVSPALRDADFSQGLTDSEEYSLRLSTDLAVYDGGVARLRLYDFDGHVVFAENGDTGTVLADDPAFQRAANGKPSATLLDSGDASSRGAVIRVLAQVVPEATGRALGVLEVQLTYDKIADQIAAETRAAIIRLAIGLAALYAVLGLISWWTTRALGRHAAAKEHQALHDPLTGLPNRDLFRRVSERAVERAQGRGALVLVDLDRFKEVNDTLGHHAGDELLQVVGRRLQESLRTDDTVARLGGDEFGILLPGESDRAATVELLTRVREAVGAEITLDDSTLTVDASFGICFFPDDADTVEDLLKNADAAMYQGKHGPTGVVVYEESAARPATDSLVLQRELRRAIADDQLLLQYQPKLHLSTGQVSCVEALVRWQHPERGLLPPIDFLPVAERSELIEPLTRWVLRQALTDCARWAEAGRPWSVAVNVSARNLATLEFVEVVRETLAATAVPPERLYLEITETAVAFDAGQVREVVERLAEIGISVSVDDFGVGYTGLSQLRAMSIREIKIDRAFIANLEESQQDRAIVASVIDLAHGLGCTVTAEGVETQQVADWLADAGCDHGQGYLWLRPSPWQEIVPAGEASGTALPASPAP